MERLPKPIRTKLRELAGKAYERELAGHLEKLAGDFDAWKNGELNAFELSRRIHAFHEGPSRELYSFYNGLDERVAVAKAVAANLLSRDEVPGDVLAAIQRQIDFFVEQAGSDS